MRCTGFEIKCSQSLTHEGRANAMAVCCRKFILMSCSNKATWFPSSGKFQCSGSCSPLSGPPMTFRYCNLCVSQRFYLNCIELCWCMASDIFDNLFSLQTNRKLRHGNLILKYRSTLKTNLLSNLAVQRMHRTRQNRTAIKLTKCSIIVCWCKRKFRLRCDEGNWNRKVSANEWEIELHLYCFLFPIWKFHPAFNFSRDASADLNSEVYHSELFLGSNT